MLPFYHLTCGQLILVRCKLALVVLRCFLRKYPPGTGDVLLSTVNGSDTGLFHVKIRLIILVYRYIRHPSAIRPVIVCTVTTIHLKYSLANNGTSTTLLDNLLLHCHYRHFLLRTIHLHILVLHPDLLMLSSIGLSDDVFFHIRLIPC